MLFDWLVVGHVIEHNPAHAVSAPRFVPVEDRRFAFLTEFVGKQDERFSAVLADFGGHLSSTPSLRNLRTLQMWSLMPVILVLFS